MPSVQPLNTIDSKCSHSFCQLALKTRLKFFPCHPYSLLIQLILHAVIEGTSSLDLIPGVHWNEMLIQQAALIVTIATDNLLYECREISIHLGSNLLQLSADDVRIIHHLVQEG